MSLTLRFVLSMVFAFSLSPLVSAHAEAGPEMLAFAGPQRGRRPPVRKPPARKPPRRPTKPTRPTQPTRPTPPPPLQGGNPSDLESEVLALTNDYRKQFNVRPLRWNNALGRAAQGHSEMMSVTATVEHIINGITPIQRIRAQGYKPLVYGENIYFGFDTAGTPEEALVQWMDSPSHRAAILNPQFTELGVGVRPDPFGYGFYFFTQDFGRPRAGR